MIEQFFLDLAKMIVGVAIGTFFGALIMRYQLQRQITNYIKNEIPHLLESPEAKAKARELAHTFIREVWKIIMEELGVEK